MIVTVVAAVSGNGRLFFHPEISIWLGFVVNVGPGGAGLGPYHRAQKIGKTRKRGSLFCGFGVVLSSPSDPP